MATLIREYFNSTHIIYRGNIMYGTLFIMLASPGTRHLGLFNNSQEDYHLKINDVMSVARILDAAFFIPRIFSFHIPVNVGPTYTHTTSNFQL